MWNHINCLVPINVLNLKKMLGSFISYTVGDCVIFYLAWLLFILADSMIEKNPRGFLAVIRMSLFVLLGQAGVSVLFSNKGGLPCKNFLYLYPDLRCC